MDQPSHDRPIEVTEALEALHAAQRTVATAPNDEAALDQLAAAIEQVRAVYHGPVEPPQYRPAGEVGDAQDLLKEGKDEEAEIAVRAFLKQHPRDIDGLILLSRIASKCGALEEADKILIHAIEIAPQDTRPRMALAVLRHYMGRHDDMVELTDQVLTLEPGHVDALSFRAATLNQARQLEEGEQVFRQLVEAWPLHGVAWKNYGYILNTIGRHGESVAAFRTAALLDTGEGVAWWGLANLKTTRFFPSDIKRMETSLLRPELTDADRSQVHFALFAALHKLREHEQAFAHLTEANAIRRKSVPFDATRHAAGVERLRQTFTPELVAAKAGAGVPDRDPIFILGMPRAGSTLIEQILASHPLVEGTDELRNMQRLANALARRHGVEDWTEALGQITDEELHMVGKAYLDGTRSDRKTDRPFFTDKMPSNWVFAGLIALAMPNAKIIDARRHPLDCGFANYAMHYYSGYNFSYGLADTGRYYRDYVARMAHLDEVMPGRVHRVIHEQLIDDFEGEVRRLLDYLELPFAESCLRFHENDRAVHTPSAQQVRQPINRAGQGKWRPYEAHLQPLKDALGDVLTRYPDVPPFPA